MDQHELISAIKALAADLGRTPRRAEFEARVKGGKYQLERVFGSYSVLLQAAGLESVRNQKKIDNSIFEVDLQKHLSSFVPGPIIERKPFPRVTSISDIHWPFDNKRVVDRCISNVERKQSQYVILNGDAWDMYSHSKFARSHNVYTPRDEQRISREKNEEFWYRVKKASKDAVCIQLLGNHDIRPMKRVLESYPEAEDWIQEKLRQLFTFDGVKTIYDAREEYFIDDICFHHGFRTQLGAHRDYTLFNSVNGHSHIGGVVYRRIRGQTLFEANSGLAGDPEAKGLTYTPQKITHWTPGFLDIDEDGPRFVMC